MEKQIFLVSFAENVVHLGIFGISGIIPKISVLLNFSIEIFSVFNSIEILVLGFRNMQEKLEKVIVKQRFHIFKQILIRAGGTWRGTQILADFFEETC